MDKGARPLQMPPGCESRLRGAGGGSSPKTMNADKGQTGGAEQRRFARVPINLDAYIAIDGGQAVPCTVRDFCIGGMFVSADPAAYASTRPQTPAMLYFALIVGGEKQDYQVPLLVARVVAKGIGCSFGDVDQSTVDLLAQLAAPGGMPSAPETNSELKATADFAPEFRKVIEPLKALVAEQTAKLCELFIEFVDDALFVAARDAGNNVDETRFLDGQRELRGLQENIRSEVPARVFDAVGLLKNPFQTSSEEAAAFKLSDLSLVEKDEFEDFLAISEIVSELEPEFSDALFELERRFSYLANREIDTSGLPVGPGALCNAVADSLKGMQSERQVTDIVFRTLRTIMHRNLAAYYDAVNELFKQYGVLPVVSRDKPAIRKSHAQSAGYDASTPDVGDDGAGLGPPAEDDLTDLMPSPENYDGRPAAPGPAPAPAATIPAGSGIRSAPPSIPTGGGVQAAPPTIPAGGGVQAAPPSIPTGGGVQAAPPTIPVGGGVQAAPPTILAGGGVQAAPPTIPVGGGVQAAPPSIPAGGGVQAAPPSIPAAEGVQATIPGGADGGVSGAQLGATTGGPVAPGGYSGWARGPVQYHTPNFHQAYSAAQTQLSLRRQLAPEVPVDLSDTGRQRAFYSTGQVADALGALQTQFAEGGAEFLDSEAFKERLMAALGADGESGKALDERASDAIEVVASLLGSLMRDAMVAKGAKGHLVHLQPSIHRAALLDEQFFDDTAHPVRQVIDRVARLRDGKSDTQQARHAEVEALIDRANREFTDDPRVFQGVAEQLDEIIDGQEADYHERVEGVVDSCEEQQRVLEARRGQSLEATDTSDRSDMPEEWHKWLDRARKLDVGERMLSGANSNNPKPVTLVWKEARDKLFVFVDEQGNKASSLTQQQVAMNLRRGVLRSLTSSDEGTAVERALFGVVDRFHREVEVQATSDPATGFLQRRFFIESIDAVLPDAETAAARNAAVCALDIYNLDDIRETGGAACADALLKAVANEMSARIRGKTIVFGRLGDNTLGVYWPTGGMQGAYKKLQTLVEPLKALSVSTQQGDDIDPDATVEIRAGSEDETQTGALHAEFAIGVAGSDDGLVEAESLLESASDACETAREMGPGSVFVAGSRNPQAEQIEKLLAYTGEVVEKGRLVLTGRHVDYLGDDDEVQPGLHVAVTAVDNNDKRIAQHLFAAALARSEAAADIDMCVFRETLAWMQENEEELEKFALVIVPFSGASVRDEDLASRIMAEFMETPVPPGRICFALPDRDVVENVVGAGELISTLREFGCRFVLDEFGSGHSNYDYIKSVEVDFVCIRSGFLDDARDNPKDFAMAKSINELVHFMGKKTIAKQDEGEELGDTMREIGIDFVYDQRDRLDITGPAA